VATQPSKPSPEVLAKLKQLREQFAAKAEMERRRRQAQDNWEQSDTYKRQYPQGQAEGGRVPSLDEMRLAITKKAKSSKVEPKIMSATERESNLQKFLEPSVVKDRMYHGTSHYASTPEKTDKLTSTGIKRFRKKPKGTFLSPDANLADYTNTKGGTEGAVYPVYAQVKNPFDYENSKHINALASQTKIDPEGVRHLLFRDDENWQVLEEPYMQRAIKQLGHDGYYTLENGRKNLAVFDPKKIKSATGNRGTYDVNEKDITKARGGRVTHAHHLEIEECPL
jgi:hypothetical protein